MNDTTHPIKVQSYYTVTIFALGLNSMSTRVKVLEGGPCCPVAEGAARLPAYVGARPALVCERRPPTRKDGAEHTGAASGPAWALSVGGLRSTIGRATLERLTLVRCGL